MCGKWLSSIELNGPLLYLVLVVSIKCIHVAHRMIVGTHSIVGVFDVNGLAIDASAVDNDIPA